MLLAFERYGCWAARSPPARSATATASRSVDERGELTYKQLDERSNALANCWRERRAGARRGRGDPRAQPPRVLRRGVRGGQVRRRDHPAQHLLRRARRSARWPSARAPTCSSTTTSTREVLEGVDDPPRGRWRAWTDDEAGSDDTLEALIERGDHQQSAEGAARAPKIMILTSGTTGTPEGRAARRAPVAGMHRRAAQQGPVPRRRGRPSCAVPMFHALGFMQAWCGIGARLDAGRAPPLRSRGDARQPRGATRPPRWSWCR